MTIAYPEYGVETWIKLNSIVFGTILFVRKTVKYLSDDVLSKEMFLSSGNVSQHEPTNWAVKSWVCAHSSNVSTDVPVGSGKDDFVLRSSIEGLAPAVL